MSILEAAISAASLYQSVSALDCGVMIVDAEGIIIKWVQPNTFHQPVTEGVKAAPGGAVDECLRTGKKVIKTIPKELYGVASKIICMPIMENGTMVGAISTGTSLDLQYQIQESTQMIATTVEQITATTEELAATAITLADDLVSLQKSGEQVIVEIKKTDSILELVSDVAANSNLLGLNAAIEAARAGEHGRGFAVVAQEIRKMADNSAQGVKDIRNILQNIQNASTNTLITIRNAAQLSEKQAAATEEISASMQQLATATAEVEKVAEII